MQLFDYFFFLLIRQNATAAAQMTAAATPMRIGTEFLFRTLPTVSEEMELDPPDDSEITDELEETAELSGSEETSEEDD